MATRTTKANLQQQLTGFVSGIQQHFPNGSLPFGNAAHASSDLVQQLQSVIQANAAADSARAAWDNALQAQKNAMNAFSPTLKDLTAFLRTYCGTNAALLADFHLAPRKVPVPLTAEQNVARNAKAAATRKARGTASKKAKAKIKGTVTPAAPAAASPAPGH